MMRSLFSGVSGLKNHQTRMDVIGNNISNVNTTGFKSSRVNFTDILSQNLQGASAPNGNMGGTNPKQIGLGSAVGAVDLLFTNGSVQSTGVNTDLALSSSNALFILDTGSGTAYTRNGDFQFDADGNYVQAGNGYFVQGWMANNGTIDTGSQVTNITIPSGKSMSPTASTTAVYSNNLDAEVPTIISITGGQVTKTGTRIYTTKEEGTMTGTPQYPVKVTAGGTEFPPVEGGPYQVGEKFTIGKGRDVQTGSMTAPPEVTITAGTGKPKVFERSMGSYMIPGQFTTDTINDSMEASSTYPVKVVMQNGDEFTLSSGTYTVGDTFKVTGTGDSMTGSTTYPMTVTAGGHTFMENSGSLVVGDTYTADDDGEQMKGTSTYPLTIVTAGGTFSSITDNKDYTVGGNYRITSGSMNVPATVFTEDGKSYSLTTGGPFTVGSNYPREITASGEPVTPVSGCTVTLTLDEGGGGTSQVVVSSGGPYEVDGTYGGKTITKIDVVSKITALESEIQSLKSSIVSLECGGIKSLTADIVNLSAPITQLEQDYAEEVDASADNPATIKLSDGSSVIQTSGKYTVENSLPIVTTLAVYDTLGSVHDLPVYFTLTSAADDTWSVALTNDGSNTTSWKEADGSTTTVTMDAQPLDFDTNGAYSAGGGKPTITLTNGAAPTQNIQLDFTQMTQYSSSSTIAGKADGNAAGVLSSISIDKTGTITGTYTNGMKQVEAQVALQRFTNPGGLTKVGESLYEDSNNAGRSGEPSTAATLGATITPAALEMSNVDIANEFTDMIITQRGFQGNSKIITVSDEMLETLINLKR